MHRVGQYQVVMRQPNGDATLRVCPSGGASGAHVAKPAQQPRGGEAVVAKVPDIAGEGKAGADPAPPGQFGGFLCREQLTAVDASPIAQRGIELGQRGRGADGITRAHLGVV
ncbi:Uncharacterised protein [Mycobacteroides abscessus subsp. abscessus]|nr:Uncharacterised protein [Mycobacteroides abscessus subsp. abscessus]